MSRCMSPQEGPGLGSGPFADVAWSRTVVAEDVLAAPDPPAWPPQSASP
jgi:hypothetical protein